MTAMDRGTPYVRAILDTALDCMIGMDVAGKICEFNAAAERTFGFKRSDVLGRELAQVIIPPALREAHRRGLAHYLTTGEGAVIGRRVELSALRADGSEFPVELAITRIATPGAPAFIAYLRDISERVRMEQLRSIRFAVTQLLTQASEVAEAASGTLRAVCERLRWHMAFCWFAEGDGGSLRCIAQWCPPESPSLWFAEASCKRTFAKGEGLPGRVWLDGRAVWIRDIATERNFPRASDATAGGVRSAFGCPVIVGTKTLGVIEFFTSVPHDEDQGVLETITTVAGHLGQFIERRQTEDKLRRRESELSDFVENATIGLHWVGPDGTIKWANRAELELLGYEESEYVGHHIAEFHVSEETIGDILRRLKAGEQLHEYPARLRCKDGSIRDVVIQSSVLFENDRFVHTRCFTRDVTARMRAEEALRESETRFRALMEQAPFSVQIFSPEGWTLRVNRAWSELWGVTLEDIRNYNVLEDPQLEAKGVLPHLRRAFAGESVVLPAIQYDPRETLPDIVRTDDPVRWVSAVAYPLKDTSGRVQEVVLVHQDVTAHRRAEEGLRESEERLRLLANTIPQLAWMANADGHIFWYNQRWYEYTGSTPEEMEGWGWQSVHDPAVLPEVLQQWKTSLTNGEPLDMVFPLRGADGEFRPFLTRVNPLRNARGDIEYWFGTNTDISDIKRLQDELREADRRKDEFLATLAHELRNPLAPLRNSLELLKMSTNPEAVIRNVRGIMDRQVTHLVRLVDDLLELSRITRGTFQLRKEPVELDTVVATAVETCKPAIEAAGHTLELRPAGDRFVVLGDSMRLAQVLCNLLNNAATYTPRGGTISVEATRNAGDVIVAVTDTGEGIEPGDFPRLFQMFSRGQSTSRTHQSGLGIGLALVRSVVEMHGGSVYAESAGRGKGSRFSVRLPLVGDGEPREHDDRSQQSSNLPSHRVLVVDDNQDAAMTLTLLLRSLGAAVESVHDGHAALRAYDEFRPDLVLLDIGMPGMDGYDVARQLRQIDQSVVLVALTGWGQDEDRQRAKAAGFDHHLVKPAGVDALTAVLALPSRHAS